MSYHSISDSIRITYEATNSTVSLLTLQLHSKTMKVSKKDNMVKWIEISKQANAKQVKAWMQVCYDYSTDYEYNWKADFLDSEGEKIGTKFDVSHLSEGDIFKVSGGTQDNKKILYGQVTDNESDDEMHYKVIDKDEAIDMLRSEENELRQKVLRQVEKASMSELEVIHAKLNDN